MKYLRMAVLALTLLSFGALSALAPVSEAEARTVKEEKKAVEKKKSTKSTKARKQSSTSEKKKNVAVASGTKDKKSKAAKRSGKKNKKSKSIQQLSEKDLWMQRAKNSTELLDRAESGREGLLGKASWYGEDFHGGTTASGINYDMYSYTAAHRTLPLGTVVEVTEENSGRSVMVCINNRGPFKRGRVIDLSMAAATDLGIKGRGIAPVNLRVVTDPEGKPLNSDEAFFIKLVRKQNAEEERVGPFEQFADATVMKEVMRGQYPEAAIIVAKVASK